VLDVKGFKLISVSFPITSDNSTPLIQKLALPLCVKWPYYFVHTKLQVECVSEYKLLVWGFLKLNGTFKTKRNHNKKKDNDDDDDDGPKTIVNKRVC